MKKRIAFQLIAGFTGIVTIAVLIIGMIFIGLYRQAAMNTKRDDMLIRTRNLAPLLSGYLDGSGTWRGLGSVFRMMDAVNDAQIWLLDANGAVLSMPGMTMQGMMGYGNPGAGNETPGDGMMATWPDLGQAALPENASNTIRHILSGEEASNESFSDVYGEAMLTVGVPVLDANGNVLGGILMHASVNAVQKGLGRAYGLLAIGLGVGLLAAIAMGVAYSERFTRPVRTMNQTAHAMAQGDYTVRAALRREDELGQLGDALDHLAVSLGEAAEESNRLEQMRKDFIANVSHEFRTPLTVIRGSTEALLDGVVQDEAEKSRRLRAILSETTGMNRLVGDLLELSRLESGRVSLQMEPVWTGEVLEDVWRSLSPVAESHAVILEKSLPENMPPVWADYGRYRQLVLIFLDNAIKHAPADSTVHLSVREGGQMVELRISDAGPGIPPEDLPHVWERFYMADKSRKRAGTGLGLSIARQLSDLMGGKVALESTVGEGTTAILRMPRAALPEDPQA